MGPAVTAQTPVYGIKYIVPGEPIRNTRQALEDNANTVEAALIRGGVAPPNAADLATVAGRVAKLELDPVTLQDAPAAQSIAAGSTATVHPSRVIDPLVIFGMAGVGAIVVVTAHVMIDNAGGSVSAGADFTLNAGVGAASPVPILMDSFSAVSARYTMRVTHTDIIPAGSKTTYLTQLTAKVQANNTIGGNAQYNRARYQVRPYV
jgi:hypothetical protein